MPLVYKESAHEFEKTHIIKFTFPSSFFACKKKKNPKNKIKTIKHYDQNCKNQ